MVATRSATGNQPATKWLPRCGWLIDIAVSRQEIQIRDMLFSVRGFGMSFAGAGGARTIARSDLLGMQNHLGPAAFATVEMFVRLGRFIEREFVRNNPRRIRAARSEERRVGKECRSRWSR